MTNPRKRDVIEMEKLKVEKESGAVATTSRPIKSGSFHKPCALPSLEGWNPKAQQAHKARKFQYQNRGGGSPVNIE